jgi:hypothetical protein
LVGKLARSLARLLLLLDKDSEDGDGSSHHEVKLVLAKNENDDADAAMDDYFFDVTDMQDIGKLTEKRRFA